MRYGVKWFTWMCAREGVDPVQRFHGYALSFTYMPFFRFETRFLKYFIEIVRVGPIPQVRVVVFE